MLYRHIYALYRLIYALLRQIYALPDRLLSYVQNELHFLIRLRIERLGNSVSLNAASAWVQLMACWIKTRIIIIAKGVNMKWVEAICSPDRSIYRQSVAYVSQPLKKKRWTESEAKSDKGSYVRIGV